MKKRVLILFFILFSISFSAWERIDLVDEFGDKTGR